MMDTKLNEAKRIINDAYLEGIHDGESFGFGHTDVVKRLNFLTVRIYTRFARGAFPGRNNGDYDYWIDVTEEESQLRIHADWSAEFEPEPFLGEDRIFENVRFRDVFPIASEQ